MVFRSNLRKKKAIRMSFSGRRIFQLPALTLLALAACREEEVSKTELPPRPVLSIVVADVESVRQATYPGRAQAVREVNIAFEVPGKILARPSDVGTTVKQGDVLAALDSDPYVARVHALEGQRAALVATLENAKTELTRREQLAQNDFVAQARVDDQIALVRATEFNIDAVEGQLDEARLNLGYTTLEAPFDGAVSNTYAERFQNVTAGQPVLRLLDTSRIEMEIAVPESLINLEEYVEAIEVEYASLPGVKIEAQIARVGNEASESTRTYPVTIVMEQPEGAEIQPGMAGRATALVRLPEDYAQTGIQVPASAVFSPNTSSGDEAFVWVIDPETSTVSATPVTVTSFADRGLLVTGLEPGARIATAGVNTLQEGQEVLLPKVGE
ncbi:efflux RND transporter periplasmic adaptor subunit [Ruegeria lacuscaerulensis]|uniref:efflux RND transporter periplasmic adaptor subunit n=1 Tax=Ruegeria lacuscaerulensis TaxID=55218 RepID=UPI00147DE348